MRQPDRMRELMHEDLATGALDAGSRTPAEPRSHPDPVVDDHEATDDRAVLASRPPADAGLSPREMFAPRAGPADDELDAARVVVPARSRPDLGASAVVEPQPGRPPHPAYRLLDVPARPTRGVAVVHAIVDPPA